MPRPYSVDLRCRVLETVDAGQPVGLIAKNFKVSVKTIYLWRKQRIARGNIKPITGYQKGHNPKITDYKAFKKFMDENSGMTLVELANKFGNIAPRTICKTIKVIGYTRKKRLMGTRKEMNTSEMNFKST